MRNYKFWQEAAEVHEQQMHLLVVIAHEGSTPGKTGFKMVITPTTLIGSIGGGIMEQELVNELRVSPQTNNFTRKLIHQENNSLQSGLVCSGNQTILCGTIERSMIQDILGHYGGSEYICMDLEGINISNTPQGLYYELLDYKNRVVVVGDGHVGRATTKILSTLDFHITVIDDRGVDLLGDNPYAHLYFRDYKQLFDINLEGSYLVMLTFGLQVDYKIIQILHEHPQRAEYYGIMGSRSKLAKLRKMLRELNYDDDFISLFSKSIGLPISDGTPEEIAISVCAELLSSKNSKELPRKFEG